jgi:DNA transformation protein
MFFIRQTNVTQPIMHKRACWVCKESFVLNPATKLYGLPNIGTTIADRLEQVGVITVGDLRRVTPAGAYKLVRDNNPDRTIPVCYYLYSLQGALDGVHWNDLSKSLKDKLLEQIQ